MGQQCNARSVEFAASSVWFLKAGMQHVQTDIQACALDTAAEHNIINSAPATKPKLSPASNWRVPHHSDVKDHTTHQPTLVALQHGLTS